MTIRLNTDVWEAIIAEGFTFENLRIIAQAMSDYLRTRGKSHKGVAIGYDTRFLSAEFARTAAEIIASNEIPVFLSDQYLPTPLLSYYVRRKELAGGLMITASHKPPVYNGVKFKGSYGGPAQRGFTRGIATCLGNQAPVWQGDFIDRFQKSVTMFEAYRTQIDYLINSEAIAEVRQTVIFSPMHGAGAGYLSPFLPNTDLRLIHSKPDPMFGGQLPEPTPRNLATLQKAVLDAKALVGLATDGDGDRFGIVDETGAFVPAHDLMPLLYRHLRKSRGWKGSVVRTTSMHDTIDRIAQADGATVHEVPVGFNNVCEKMLRDDVLMGGEESGGFGYKYHIPERDGILSCLLFLELLGSSGRTPSNLVQTLRQEFGPFSYGKSDEYGSVDKLRKRMTALRKNAPHEIGSFSVDRVNLIDGIKFYFRDKGWMLLRISETESMARIYAGADQKETVRALLSAGKALLFDG